MMRFCTRLHRWSDLNLPVATPRERRLRSVLRVYPFVIVGFAMLLVAMLIAGLVPPKTVAILLGVAWFSTMGLLVFASRLAGAYYAGRQHLRNHRYMVCPACEYDLGELAESAACPECGQAYNPQSLRETWENIYSRLEKTAPGSKKSTTP